MQKWQLLRLDMMVSGFQSMRMFQQKMEPMQDKLYKYVQRELDDIEDADSWKFMDDLEDEDGPEDPDSPESGELL